MVVYRKADESISGAKIYCEVGGYSEPKSAKGQNACTFSLHVFARVVKAVKVASSPEHAESDEIQCRTARAVANVIDMAKQKVQCSSNHRAFKGYLRDRATCTISTPEEWQA